MTSAAPSFTFFPFWKQSQHHRERRSGRHIWKGYKYQWFWGCDFDYIKNISNFIFVIQAVDKSLAATRGVTRGVVQEKLERLSDRIWIRSESSGCECFMIIKDHKNNLVIKNHIHNWKSLWPLSIFSGHKFFRSDQMLEIFRAYIKLS